MRHDVVAGPVGAELDELGGVFFAPGGVVVNSGHCLKKMRMGLRKRRI